MDDRNFLVSIAKKHQCRFIQIDNRIYEVYRAEYLPDSGERAWFVEKIEPLIINQETKEMNKEALMAIAQMLDAVVEGALEEFVKIPYGASHEDVLNYQDWIKAAKEARYEFAKFESV